MALTSRTALGGTFLALIVASLAFACGDSTSSGDDAVGGSSGQAGSSSKGGATGQAGTKATGGANHAGATNATGGVPASGGSASGGSAAGGTAGGTATTGGTATAGATSNGGAAGAATAGATSNGGAAGAATAGATSNGGAAGSAGSPSTNLAGTSTTAGTTSNGGAAGSGGTAASAGAAGATVDCSSGANTAPIITGQHSTASFPTPQGLTGGATSIADGTYHRTAVIYYEKQDNGPDTSQFQGTITIKGNTVINRNRPLPDDETVFGGIYVLSGTNILVTAQCPAALAGQNAPPMPFTYSAGVIKTYDASSKKESVYTLQ